MVSKPIRVGIILGAATTALGFVVYSAYKRDITSAQKRIKRGKVIDTHHSPIQYANVGHGIPVLVIHGAGGGFDQGLFTAKGALGDDMANHYRIIAPSRFGYLGTPMPADGGDATPAAQADAHAVLLDALDIQDKVVVLGTSAGALSSMQFAIKYPDRVSALVLQVPDSWKPPMTDYGSAETEEQLMDNDFVMNTVLKSDFIMWTFTKVAKDQMLSFLGASPELQRTMTPHEQLGVSELIKLIFPVSQRQAGIVNDGINSKNLQRYMP